MSEFKGTPAPWKLANGQKDMVVTDRPLGEASNDGRVLFQVCPKRSGSEGVTGKNSIRVDEREMLKLVDSGEYSVRCRSEIDQSKAVMLIRHARYEYELV